jgi:hypothetical protein
MAIPGFSAEMSLSKSRQTHSVSPITSVRQLQVIPQFRMQCLVDALTVYNECLGLGGWSYGGWRNCDIDFNNNLNKCGDYEWPSGFWP